ERPQQVDRERRLALGGPSQVAGGPAEHIGGELGGWAQPDHEGGAAVAGGQGPDLAGLGLEALGREEGAVDAGAVGSAGDHADGGGGGALGDGSNELERDGQRRTSGGQSIFEGRDWPSTQRASVHSNVDSRLR